MADAAGVQLAARTIGAWAVERLDHAAHSWVMGVGALIVSIVAALLSLFAILSARQKASEANRSAERSADAAEQSAKAADRAAAAAEEQLDLTRPPKIAFVVSRRNDVIHVLRNVGTETATEVTITDPTGCVRPPAPSTVASRAGVDFEVFTSWGVNAPASILVSCAELPEPVHVPMPA